MATSDARVRTEHARVWTEHARVRTEHARVRIGHTRVWAGHVRLRRTRTTAERRYLDPKGRLGTSPLAARQAPRLRWESPSPGEYAAGTPGPGGASRDTISTWTTCRRRCGAPFASWRGWHMSASSRPS